MYWRDRSLAHGEPKRRAMEAIVQEGREPGLLAYEAGEPVGWVAIAPREDYGALVRSPQYTPRDTDEGVWSVVCFAVDRYTRRRGIAGALLSAAVEHACTRGAAAVEAYPHVSDPSDYMGARELFAAQGFEPVREANKRTIVRRACSPQATVVAANAGHDSIGSVERTTFIPASANRWKAASASSV
jgi:ribosomal protein S18 acetylase RimI-like enzyme